MWKNKRGGGGGEKKNGKWVIPLRFMYQESFVFKQVIYLEDFLDITFGDVFLFF